MVDEYARRGFDIVGIVGHDARPPEVQDAPITVLRGVEHELDKSSKLHVITYPNFSFLAHPRLTFPTDTKSHARRIIDQYDLDGVEKINRGTVQYSGHIAGVVELAGDDAHNPPQVGSSFFHADAWPPTTTRLRNPGVMTHERWAGRALQATSLAGERLWSSKHE